MARLLNEKEKNIYIKNRDELYEQLSELQADLEDLSDNALVDCRLIMLKRINECMELILETDEDNL